MKGLSKQSADSYLDALRKEGMGEGGNWRGNGESGGGQREKKWRTSVYEGCSHRK